MNRFTAHFGRIEHLLQPQVRHFPKAWNSMSTRGHFRDADAISVRFPSKLLDLQICKRAATCAQIGLRRLVECPIFK